MITYAMINFSCFELSQTKSPGWRPAFKYFNWGTALAGTIFCIVCMFLTDPLSAVLAGLIGFGLFKYIQYRNPKVDWGSAIEAVEELQTVKRLMRMRHHGRNAKNFRPSYLVFTKRGDINDDPLVSFCTTLRFGYGATIYAKVITTDVDINSPEGTAHIAQFCDKYRPSDRTFGYLDSLGKRREALAARHRENAIKKRRKLMALDLHKEALDEDDEDGALANAFTAPSEKLIEGDEAKSDDFSVPAAEAEEDGEDDNLGFLSDKLTNLVVKKKAFYDVVFAQSFDRGVAMLIQGAGLGALRPNTTVFGYMENWQNRPKAEVDNYVLSVRQSFQFNMNTMIVRGHQLLDYTRIALGQTIDIWWLVEDGGVIVLIPYLLSQHQFWNGQGKGKRSRMRLMIIVHEGTPQSEKDTMRSQLEKFMQNLRFADWEVHCVEKETESSEEEIIYDNIINSSQKIADQPLTMKNRTMKWLLFSKTIAKYSRAAKLVIVTLPVPRINFDSSLYLSWLDLLTRRSLQTNLPIILMRGNGINVLTTE